MAKAGEMGKENISPIEKIESNQASSTELILQDICLDSTIAGGMVGFQHTCITGCK